MYQLYDFSKWKVSPKKWRGANPKTWLENSIGQRALFKYTKVNNGMYSGDHWSEKMASDLIKLFGLVSMDVDMGYYNDRLGCLCYDITESHGAFTEAWTVLPPKSTATDRSFTLNDLKVSFSPNAYEEAIHMLIIDFIIGNNDRHTENFAILNTSGLLCPLYDNASSLACRVDEANIIKMKKDKMQYQAFLDRPKSKMTIGSVENAPHTMVIPYLRQQEPAIYNKISQYIKSLSASRINSVLSNFSPVVSTDRLAFIERVLVDRISQL